MGLRYVKGLRAGSGERIEAERKQKPFRSVDDLATRCRLREDELSKLAWAGALSSFGLTRRAAVWQADLAAKPAGELFAEQQHQERGAVLNSQFSILNSPEELLPALSPFEETLADYDSMQLTVGPHLVAHLREPLRKHGVKTAAELGTMRSGMRVATAGAIIVRQRPGTAKGFVFLTLEDETGMSQAIVRPDLFREHRTLLVTSPGIIVEGVLQNENGNPSIRAERFWPLETEAGVPSHDFH